MSNENSQELNTILDEQSIEDNIQQISESLEATALSEFGQDELFATHPNRDFSIDIAKEIAGNQEKKNGKSGHKHVKPKRLQTKEKTVENPMNQTMILPIIQQEDGKESTVSRKVLTQETMAVPDISAFVSKKDQPVKKTTRKSADDRNKKKKDVTPQNVVTLKEVMASTVDSALRERDDGIIHQRVTPKQFFKSFGGKKGRHELETERLWEEPTSQETKEEEIFEEPGVDETFRLKRRKTKHMRHVCLLSGIFVCVLLSISVCAALGWPNQQLREHMAYPLVLAGILLLVNLFSKDVWKKMWNQMKAGRLTYAFGACLSSIVTMGSCIVDAFLMLEGVTPMALPAGCLLLAESVSIYLEEKAEFEAYKLIKTGGEPPKTLSNIDAGIFPQNGRLYGFYHTLHEESTPSKAEAILIPVIVCVSMVLTAIAYQKTENVGTILWNWSVYLCIGLPISLALAQTGAFASVQHFFVSKGIAVAGYVGARPYRYMRRLILTENELFPKDTVILEGYKTFSEERKKVLSYATSITRVCESQLEELFERELNEEGGFHCQVDDLHFYEEGGVGATIHGESVLMGSAFFMKKQHVSIPSNTNIKTGVFLAIDGQLSCIFGIKYMPSRNTEWSLRALRRNRIRPVMAVRSGNVTPAMLKRKYSINARPIYPKVDVRVALSTAVQQEASQSGILIYRGGVMGIVEAAIGCKKMVKATWGSMILSCLGSGIGLFLTSYLTRIGSTQTITPLYVLLYGCLWLLPCLVLFEFSRHI